MRTVISTDSGRVDFQAIIGAVRIFTFQVPHVNAIIYSIDFEML